MKLYIIIFLTLLSCTIQQQEDMQPIKDIVSEANLPCPPCPPARSLSNKEVVDIINFEQNLVKHIQDRGVVWQIQGQLPTGRLP